MVEKMVSACFVMRIYPVVVTAILAAQNLMDFLCSCGCVDGPFHKRFQQLLMYLGYLQVRVPQSESFKERLLNNRNRQLMTSRSSRC
jgi:hypothetical protein